jgi:hypothetical protein
MMRAKTFECSVVLAWSVLILAGLSAAAGDMKDKDKSALSGVWSLNGGETKIEFSEKNVLKISPHGDSNIIALICEYTAGKEGLVKAKITDFEGKDEAKTKVKEILPVGTDFSFKWQVKGDTAKLVEMQGKEVEPLKSHLEGEYSRKK